MRLSSRWLLAALLLAVSQRGLAQSAVVDGVVYDSLRHAPLAHASIIASVAVPAHDTVFHSALSDDRGRFSLRGLLPGRYTISVEHEFIDSVGISVPDIDVDVPSSGTVAISVAIPSPHTIRRALCPATADDGSLGVMLGVVRRGSGEPVRDAVVVFTWSDFDVDRSTLSVSNKQLTATALTNVRGVYVQCTLPIGRSLFVQAQGDAQSHSGILEETLGSVGVQVRDLRIASESALAANDSSAATRGLVLNGRVVDVLDHPISAAQVNLPGSSRNTATNERGEFRLADVAPGTYGVEVLAIGYAPRMLRVDIDRASPALSIRMERIAVILDSLQVIASRTGKSVNTFHRDFDWRSRTAQGSYLTRAQLDSFRPMTVFDALRRVSSVRLVLSRNNGSYIAVSTRGGVNFDSTLCPLEVFIDGMKLSPDDVYSIPPEALYGIEVQSVATTPVKYGVRSCGAVFLWTR